MTSAVENETFDEPETQRLEAAGTILDDALMWNKSSRWHFFKNKLYRKVWMFLFNVLLEIKGLLNIFHLIYSERIKL